jgi:hypothetical protein
MFRKLDAAADASRDPKKQNMKNLRKCLKQWIYARSVDSSYLKFAEPKTEKAISSILKLSEDMKKGTFTPFRERDKLSVGLGNPEHTGHTRGIGKRTTWKQGFPAESNMYKKHSRDREFNLELQVKALVQS